MSGQENSNFRRKIKRELDEYGEVLTRKESDIRGRNKRIAKEQKIQIKLLVGSKIMEAKYWAVVSGIITMVEMVWIMLLIQIMIICFMVLPKMEDL